MKPERKPDFIKSKDEGQGVAIEEPVKAPDSLNKICDDCLAWMNAEDDGWAVIFEDRRECSACGH